MGGGTEDITSVGSGAGGETSVGCRSGRVISVASGATIPNRWRRGSKAVEIGCDVLLRCCIRSFIAYLPVRSQPWELYL